MARLYQWLAALAGLCLVGTVGAWLLGGAHAGWTRTSLPVERTDEVTGLTYREYERGFQPGLDWLGAGLGVASILGVGAWLCRHRASAGGRG